jgi:hypothetical protein
MAKHLITIGMASLLLVTACGGGSNGSGSGAPQYGSEEFGLTNAELNSRIEAAEAKIATCMRDAGFEYLPVDAVTIRRAMDADKSKPGITDEEYVAQYGFGITTVFEDPVISLGRGEQNATIYAGLAPGDQVAYDRALVGEPGSVGLARALEDEDLSGTGGCTRAAVESLFAKDELNGSYVNPGDVLLEQDPRMIAAIEAWSTCLKRKGFDYAHPDDVTDELTERLDAVLGGADPASLTGAAAAALAELQDEERAVAVVATACEEEEISPVQEEIESEIYGAPQPEPVLNS